MDKQPFREELVKQVSEAGQFLMEHADQLVPKEGVLIGDYDIDIIFAMNDRFPEIRINWSAPNTITGQRLWKMED